MKVKHPPKISCILPTTHYRRAFLPNAIRYFLQQDYKNKELLIVYGSTETTDANDFDRAAGELGCHSADTAFRNNLWPLSR